MTDPSAPARLRFLPVAAWLAVASLLGAAGWWIVGSKYAAYDDEGYLLLSLRNFLAGLPLYREVFSQYGPVPFVYHFAVTLGGTVPLTHEFGQRLTVVHWVGGALLCGALVTRLGRQPAAGFAAAAAVFCLTWQTSVEPSHPGSLLLLLLAATAALAAAASADRPPRPAIAAALGALAAAVVLVKINVGLFLVAALGTVWLHLHGRAEGRRQRLLAFAAGVLLVALPWLLAGRHAGLPWVRTLGLLVSAAAAALLWIRPAATPALPVNRFLVPALAGAAGAAAAVLLVPLARGTAPADLVDALLVQPLRLPAHFLLATGWHPAVGPVAVVCFGLVARAGWELRRHGALSVPVVRLVLALRLLALAGAVAGLPWWASLSAILRFTDFCVPLLPVFALPLDPAAADRRARWLLALLAALQVLHLYPVAGSQRGWGIFLAVPVFALGTLEALRLIAPPGARQPHVARLLAVAAAFACLVPVVRLAAVGGERYRSARPLDLPGTERRRLPEAQRLALRLVVLNASLHADLLFSYPGMGSFNVWSGVPPPSPRFATQWFWLLSTADRLDIRNRLAATPRSALVTCPPSLDFLAHHGVDTRSDLGTWLEISYRPLFRSGDYVFHVPLGSSAVPFGIVQVTPPATPGAAPRWETCLVLDGRFGRLDLARHPASPGAAFPELGAAEIEPVATHGHATGPRAPLVPGTPLRGLYRIILPAPSPLPPPGAAPLLLVVRDPTGATLAEALAP